MIYVVWIVYQYVIDVFFNEMHYVYDLFMINDSLLFYIIIVYYVM